MKTILVKLIKFYQRKAPKQLRASCRFEPSCSNYGILAINKYGSFKGSIMTIKRIFRCRKPNGGVEYP